jgi:hypothetical protein
MTKHLLALAVLALSPLATAQAQYNLSPTDGGGNWQVRCTRLTANPLAPACNGSYTDAVRVAVAPAGWASVPVAGPAGNAYYIATNSSASTWESAPDELDNYEYTFRTTFDVGVIDPSVPQFVNLNVFRLDNYFMGWSVNGSAFSTTGMSPNGASVVNQEYWATPYQLMMANPAFVVGQNTLELRVRGNGRTDAILAQGTYSVPEPGSMLLLSGGLVLLGVQMRRRRNV